MKDFINRIPRNHLVILILIGFFLVFKKGIDRVVFIEASEFLEKNSDLGIATFLVITFLVILSLVGFCIKWKQGFRPYFSTYLLCTVILLVYLFLYRLNSYWKFYSTPILYLHWLKYADLILAVLLIEVSILVRNTNIHVEVNENLPELLEDNFETFGNRDLLGRENIAIKISEFIRGTTPKKTFGIGIVGDWGAGKSIFINHFLKKDLERHDSIIVEFKPWAYRRDTDLVSAFFAHVEKEIAKYSPTLGRDITRYAEKFKDLSDDKLSKFTLLLIELVNSRDGKSEDDLAEEIKKGITALGKKIIIIIDDVDRLKPKEIFEVLKIVRSCFDFPNTFFVVAYDSGYLDSGVSVATKLDQSKRYAEKIIQLEFPLPPYPKVLLINELRTKLLEEFPEENLKLIVANAVDELTAAKASSTSFGEKNWLEEMLESLRDVVRVINELKLAFSCVSPEEFDLSDFLFLSIIKVKYPAVYRLLAHKIIIKKTLGNNRKDLAQRLGFDEDYFKNMKPKDLFLKDEKEKEKIQNALKYLFKDNRPRDRSINNPTNSIIYFGNSLWGRLSYREYKNAKSKGGETFKQYITKELRNGRERDLSQVFLEDNSYDGKDDFESSITAELELSRKASSHSYIKTDLFSKINKINNIVDNFYININEQNARGRTEAITAYSAFLVRILVEEAEYPFEAEASQLQGFLSVFLQSTGQIELLEGIFTKEKVQGLLLRLFIKRLNHPDTKIDESLFNIYRANQSAIDPKSAQITLNPIAGRHLLDFIKKDKKNVHDYFLMSPRLLEFGQTESTYTFEPFTPQYFNGWDDFKLFLQEWSRKDKSAEFLLSKFDEFEKSGYRGFKSTNAEMRNIQ